MQLTRIVCPHCEQSVEVQTTSVTRSRECPHCGKIIIVQMTSRDRKQNRKALLTAVTEASEPTVSKPEVVESPPADPQALEGDPLSRMIHDPEVKSRIASLKWGIVIVCGMIVFAVTQNYSHWWPGLRKMSSQVVHMLLRRSAARDPGEKPADLLPSGRNVAGARPSGSETGTRPPGGETGDAPPLDLPPGPQLTDHEAAKKAAVQFLEAKKVDERLLFVRDRKINEQKIRDYYARRGDHAVAYDRIEALDVNSQGKFTFSFTVVLSDGARRGIIVGKSRSGQYLVDWASFALYGEMDWSDFLVKHPRQPTMFRVLAAQGDFFGGEFADPGSLFCLKLMNPADTASPFLYGYVQKSESLGRILAEVIAKSGGTPAPMMLKLSFPGQDGTGNQVWINEFIGEGWIARNW